MKTQKMMLLIKIINNIDKHVKNCIYIHNLYIKKYILYLLYLLLLNN